MVAKIALATPKQACRALVLRGLFCLIFMDVRTTQFSLAALN